MNLLNCYQNKDCQYSTTTKIEFVQNEVKPEYRRYCLMFGISVEEGRELHTVVTKY